MLSDPIVIDSYVCYSYDRKSVLLSMHMFLMPVVLYVQFSLQNTFRNKIQFNKMSFNYSIIILKVFYALFLSLMNDLQEVPKV